MGWPRRYNWAEKLTGYIVYGQEAGLKCDWENNNCASWANGAVMMQNGRDIYAEFEGESDDPKTAYLAIKRHGYEDLNDVIRQNFKEKPISFANRGDVVFVPTDGEGGEAEFAGLGMAYAIGIADPPFYWALGFNGLGRGLLRDAVACFDIEEKP